MEKGHTAPAPQGGKYLMVQRRAKPTHRPKACGRWLRIAALLVWDGVLVYMIMHCLIEAVYGAVFIAVVSIYLGYQMKQEE